MVLMIVCVGIRALKAPLRKNAGMRQRSTWAVRYSMRVSIPLVSISWIMVVACVGFKTPISIILFKYLYNSMCFLSLT